MGIWALLVLNEQEVAAAFQRAAPKDKTPAERLIWPAIGLIVAGMIDFTEAAFFAGGELYAAPGFERGIFALLGLPALVLGGLRVAGGVQMLRTQSHRFAFFASIASLLPVSWGAVLGLPAGIWALVVLSKEEVKEAFGRAKQQSRSRPAQEASDPEEKERSAELAEIPPGWLGLAIPATFALGWIFVGAMWNFRVGGLAIGFAVLAVITYGMIRWQLEYLPKLRAELARQSAFRRTLALVWAAALFALSMLFVFGAQVTAWDLWGDMRPGEWLKSMPDNASGTEAILNFSLDKLASLRGVAATELFVDFSASRYGNLILTSMQVVTFVTCAMLATVCVFGAVQAVIDTRRYRSTWKYSFAPSFLTAFLLMSTIAIVPAVRLMPGFTMTSLPLREMRSSATSGQLETAVDAWAQRTGYTVRSNRTWQITNGKTGDIGGVRMLELWAPSPFDRRRVAGRFVVRPLPTLRIKCVSVDEPAESYVSVDLPQITKDSQEESLWPALLDSLQTAITTTLSQPPGSSGADSK